MEHVVNPDEAGYLSIEQQRKMVNECAASGERLSDEERSFLSLAQHVLKDGTNLPYGQQQWLRQLNERVK